MIAPVLIAARVHPVLTEGLEKAGYSIIIKEQITKEEALAIIPDCAGLITSNRLIVDKELIHAAPHLQWIGRMGSGMEIIDHVYARAKGINCYSSPEGNCNAVGEHALGMLLSLTKKIRASSNEVADGQWKREANRGIELEGRTIGIIGFGHTGKAFAKKLMGFDMKLLAYDIARDIDYPAYATPASLEDIYKEAEVLSFHLPYSKANHHFFDASFIDRMHRSFILINTSRGDIIDTAAAYEALVAGKISGIALDVVEGEPLEKMNEKQQTLLSNITTFPNAIVTPHVAGYSIESIYKMSHALLQKICHVNVKH